MRDEQTIKHSGVTTLSLAYITIATAERFCQQFLHDLRAMRGFQVREKKRILGQEIKQCEDLYRGLTKTYEEALTMTDNPFTADGELERDSWYLVQLINYWGGMDEYERMSLLRHAKEIGHPDLDADTLEMMRPKTIKDAAI